MLYLPNGQVLLERSFMIRKSPRATARGLLFDIKGDDPNADDGERLSLSGLTEDAARSAD